MGPGHQHPRVVDPPDPGELRTRIAATVSDLRSRTGRSLADVANAAGIGKSTLHAIESGDANPGIETLWALARALDVPFGALLEPPAPSVRVVRADEGPRVDSEDAGMMARLLATTAHGARVEVYALSLAPTGGRDAAAHTGGTTEHVLVTRGRLRVGPREQPVDLEVGDLASFPGDVPHIYDALETDTKAVLIIEYS
ncbi:MAG: XRE family transcriptional regulator [Nitriliruptor sp.]|nr:MAG: XRE family transcriptional regulator [Nitriliruptor sp.]